MNKQKGFCLILLCLALIMILSGCTSGAVKDTIAAIDAIKTSGGKHYMIDDAYKKYAALSEDEKGKVTNAGALLVARAEAEIETMNWNINVVDEDHWLEYLTDAKYIYAADSAYKEVPEDLKKTISGANDLISAQNGLKLAQQKKKEIQTVAEKLFTKLSGGFKNPYSIKMKNAWYTNTAGKLHYFTFEFEVKNGLGISETVYYGTDTPLTELTDDAIREYSAAFKTWGKYFEEGEVKAKNSVHNIELDSSAIQRYFEMYR